MGYIPIISPSSGDDHYWIKLSSERVHDRVSIMPHHPLVTPSGRARRSHRVGVKVVYHLHARVIGYLGSKLRVDGAFEEDRFDILGLDLVDESRNLPCGGLGFGGHGRDNRADELQPI